MKPNDDLLIHATLLEIHNTAKGVKYKVGCKDEWDGWQTWIVTKQDISEDITEHLEKRYEERQCTP